MNQADRTKLEFLCALRFRYAHCEQAVGKAQRLQPAAHDFSEGDPAGKSRQIVPTSSSSLWRGTAEALLRMGSRQREWFYPHGTRSHVPRDGEPKDGALPTDLESFSNHILAGDGFLGKRSIGFKNERDRLLDIGPSSRVAPWRWVPGSSSMKAI